MNAAAGEDDLERLLLLERFLRFLLSASVSEGESSSEESGAFFFLPFFITSSPSELSESEMALFFLFFFLLFRSESGSESALSFDLFRLDLTRPELSSEESLSLSLITTFFFFVLESSVSLSSAGFLRFLLDLELP